MTNIYKVAKKAEDLRIGDLLLSWWISDGKPVEQYYPHRITNITYRRAPRLGQIMVHLDDGRGPLPLHNEQLVVVQEIA